jgi:hypothetical protein
MSARGLGLAASVLLILTRSYALCPNSCSGHGTCGAGNLCSCFPGWNGGAADCSYSKLLTSTRKMFSYVVFALLEQCPSGTAWSDKAHADNRAHVLAVCSNRGTCELLTGLCQCFDGYAGNACQRSETHLVLRYLLSHSVVVRYLS